MRPVTIYGFRCTSKDEKVLTLRVNGYLATLKRTTSKAKTASMLKVMKALLKAGADPNLTDNKGRTPMALARLRDEPKKIRLLRANGAIM